MAVKKEKITPYRVLEILMHIFITILYSILAGVGMFTLNIHANGTVFSSMVWAVIVGSCSAIIIKQGMYQW